MIRVRRSEEGEEEEVVEVDAEEEQSCERTQRKNVETTTSTEHIKQEVINIIDVGLEF